MRQITMLPVPGILLVMCLLMSCEQGTKVTDSAKSFKAYYTKINSGEEFEKYSRTGPYADLVIEVGEANGRLVFWRGSSYLPYWETPNGRWFLDELVARDGDGNEEMPDRTNATSHVRLIIANDDSVLVHWRYEPDFNLSGFFDVRPEDDDHRANDIEFVGLRQTDFVDEYFIIKPWGDVRRIVKRGTDSYADWTDPLNKTVQTLALEDGGIANKQLLHPATSEQAVQHDVDPTSSRSKLNEVFQLKFDENGGNRVLENVSGQDYKVAGHHAIWKAGVSGSALQFDGYTTQIEVPVIDLSLDNEFTIEAWIAMNATPWNWTPIVQYGTQETLYLGVNDKGQIGFRLNNEELISDVRLPTYEWYHAMGTFQDGEMKLYLNGELVANRQAVHVNLMDTNGRLLVGQGKPMEATHVVRFKSDFPSAYGFEGLIDEVVITNKALSQKEVMESFKRYSGREKPVDMERKTMPHLESTGRFDARYTRLDYHEAWDNMWRVGDYADVVVEFENSPTKLVFWRGCSYIPAYVSENGYWFNNEFNEIWATETEQCMEPIGDIKGYFTHVRILEKTAARIVIHWRYALNDTRQGIGNYDAETGWGEYADWYYHIYPDGTVAVKNILWSDMSEYRGSVEGMREWQESMVIVPPGMHPEQIYVTDSLFFISDLQRNSHISAWGPEVDPKEVIKINLKSTYDPFIIGEIIRGGTYYGELTDYSVFPFWNHWPVAMMLNDGRNGKDDTRMGHSSVLQLTLQDDSSDIYADAPWVMQSRLEGMTNKSMEELILMANSYLRAPQVESYSGLNSITYDKTQKAYLIEADGNDLLFEMMASATSPLYNPCFVVDNWQSNELVEITINGELGDQEKIKQGVVINSSGEERLIVWIRQQFQERVVFVFAHNDPS